MLHQAPVQAHGDVRLFSAFCNIRRLPGLLVPTRVSGVGATSHVQGLEWDSERAY